MILLIFTSSSHNFLRPGGEVGSAFTKLLPTYINSERVAENAPHEIYVIGAPTKKQGVSTRITLM